MLTTEEMWALEDYLTLRASVGQDLRAIRLLGYVKRALQETAQLAMFNEELTTDDGDAAPKEEPEWMERF